MDKKKKVGLAVLIIIALYVAASIFFQYHYFIGTKVNGYSCAFRSVSKAKELIKKDVKSYKITIKERDKKKESISVNFRYNTVAVRCRIICRICIYWRNYHIFIKCI